MTSIFCYNIEPPAIHTLPSKTLAWGNTPVMAETNAEDGGLSPSRYWLSAQEEKRLTQFSTHQLQQRYGHIHTRLNQQLAILCNNQNHIPEIETGQHGKPRLKHFSHIHFNHSDTDHYAVAAFWNQPVGIDTERINENKPDKAVTARFFSVADQEAIGDDPSRFVLFWTRKEAILKLTGTGISDDLHLFSVSQPEWTGNGSCIGLASGRQKAVYVYSFRVHTLQYSLAVFQPLTWTKSF